jgi:transglutaminase-like putative cysteine protease
MRTRYRVLRSISAITLFFFCWSFMPLWQAVAWAAENQKPGVNSQKSVGKQQPENRTMTTGDRFEKALESIREKIGKAEEKASKNQDFTTEVAEVKAKRADIESADVEFKKEFAATEKKLKDAKLPKEILDRHAKFVKHYEDNLNELKTNLDDIEQAKTASDRRAKIGKTRLHLEKTKAPSKHQKLDPNNLPFKARKASKTVEPRLKKEDFERDFPQRKSHGKRNIADRRLLPDLLASCPQPKPILLAFNEIASDVPLQFPRPLGERTEVRGGFDPVSIVANDFAPQLTAFDDSVQFFLAQVTGQPSADDLAETPDVQFTDAIRAKALELRGNPVIIYNWVRNNIEYAPTYGSIQGADMCLQSKICNDMDTASLLIALLRVSGISSKYVYGTVEVPVEKVMNWVGGVTNPQMAGTIFATNGIPATSLISGGTIKAIQLEHVWVKAFIDYIPSRGAVQRRGDSWIPLDASFKQYTYTPGIDIQSAVPFDAQSFANQILSTATTNTTDSSVSNVNSALVQQTMQGYQAQVQSYIQQNNPHATVGDVIGKKEIVQQNYPILIGTLPYKTVQIGSEFSTVPANLRETMSFSIPDPTGAGTGLTYITGMPQIAGKKITLSFSPATSNDEAVIESLLPQPNPDRTPIAPSQLPTSFPAYLINLVPQLRIEGAVVATGAPTMMGSDQAFTMSLNESGIGTSNIDNIVKAGEYFGIGVDTGLMGVRRLSALKDKLDTTKAMLETQNYTDLAKDDVIGDLLYTTMATYFAELDASDMLASRSMNVIRYRAPSVGMFSFVLNVKDIFGVPASAGSNAMMMDVDRIMQAVFSKDGSMDAVRRYMFVSGAKSSALEHAVPEQLWSTADNTVQGISAVKALSIANNQGMPIYTINQSNVNTILPQLQLNGDAMTDIQNAVNAGKVVTAPKTNITFNGWTGCGYIITDPTTGAGAYMISGGANGVWLFLLWAGVFLFVCALGALGPLGLVIGIVAGALIEYFGAQSIKVAYGIQNSYAITAQGILGSVLSIITGLAMGAGLLALSAMFDAALIPVAVFAVAALILYASAAIVDYLLFWSKNQIIPSMGRTVNV